MVVVLGLVVGVGSSQSGDKYRITNSSSAKYGCRGA